MDEAAIAQVIGDMTIIAKAVVKLYRGGKSGWTEWRGGGVGVLVWCATLQGTQFFKLIRLADGMLALDEELYEDFHLNYVCKKTM
eukprot:6170445-Prymnesium_polylepis.1